MTKRTAKHAAPDPRFASMLDALLREPAVTQSRMFGSAGLKVGGKVFVMLVKGSSSPSCQRSVSTSSSRRARANTSTPGTAS